MSPDEALEEYRKCCRIHVANRWKERLGYWPDEQGMRYLERLCREGALEQCHERTGYGRTAYWFKVHPGRMIAIMDHRADCLVTVMPILEEYEEQPARVYSF